VDTQAAGGVPCRLVGRVGDVLTVILGAVHLIGGAFDLLSDPAIMSGVAALLRQHCMGVPGLPASPNVASL
jgi:hypothetical protein